MTKNLWNIINNIASNKIKDKRVPIRHFSNEKLIEPRSICEKIDNFFCNIAKKLFLNVEQSKSSNIEEIQKSKDNYI